MEAQKYDHRILLMTDPHYMPNETVEEYKELYPGSNPCAAIGDALGYTQTEKMSIILDDITKFAKDTPVEAVLVLGDLGTDDYGFRKMAENYVLKFKEEVMAKFPGDSYALPGNHDSYPNEIWNQIFGYDRQYSVKIGDSVFIMLDVYSDFSTVNASGAVYGGIDADWVVQELEKYPTERIYFCSHYYKPDEANEIFDELVKHNDRVVCLFQGHVHKNKIICSEKWNDKLIIDLGGYAYNGELIDGKYRFDGFDEAWAWGYGVLEWNEQEVHYYHVKNPRTYVGRNGCVDYCGAIDNEVTIKLK